VQGTAIAVYGKPIVVYHGTDLEFDEFDPLAIDTLGDPTARRFDGGFAGRETYFSASKFYAEAYGHQRSNVSGRPARLVRAYINIKNPLRINKIAIEDEISTAIASEVHKLKTIPIKAKLAEEGTDLFELQKTGNARWREIKAELDQSFLDLLSSSGTGGAPIAASNRSASAGSSSTALSSSRTHLAKSNAPSGGSQDGDGPIISSAPLDRSSERAPISEPSNLNILTDRPPFDPDIRDPDGSGSTSSPDSDIHEAPRQQLEQIPAGE